MTGAPIAGDRPDLILATSLGQAKGGLAVTAAVAVAFGHERPATLFVEFGAGGWRGPTMLASGSARELEDVLRAEEFDRVSARGRLCWLGLGDDEAALGELRRAVAALPLGAFTVAHMPGRLWQAALDEFPDPAGALLRADLPPDRSLAALTVIDLHGRRIPARVASRPLGRVATRRALAGLESGGSVSQRVARLASGLARRARTRSSAAEPGVGLGGLVVERGEALMMVLAAAVVILL